MQSGRVRKSNRPVHDLQWNYYTRHVPGHEDGMNSYLEANRNALTTETVSNGVTVNRTNSNGIGPLNGELKEIESGSDGTNGYRLIVNNDEYHHSKILNGSVCKECLDLQCKCNTTAYGFHKDTMRCQPLPNGIHSSRTGSMKRRLYPRPKSLDHNDNHTVTTTVKPSVSFNDLSIPCMCCDSLDTNVCSDKVLIKNDVQSSSYNDTNHLSHTKSDIAIDISDDAGGFVLCHNDKYPVDDLKVEDLTIDDGISDDNDSVIVASGNSDSECCLSDVCLNVDNSSNNDRHHHTRFDDILPCTSDAYSDMSSNGEVLGDVQVNINAEQCNFPNCNRSHCSTCMFEVEPDDYMPDTLKQSTPEYNVDLETLMKEISSHVVDGSIPNDSDLSPYVYMCKIKIEQAHKDMLTEIDNRNKSKLLVSPKRKTTFMPSYRDLLPDNQNQTEDFLDFDIDPSALDSSDDSLESPKEEKLKLRDLTLRKWVCGINIEENDPDIETTLRANYTNSMGENCFNEINEDNSNNSRNELVNGENSRNEEMLRDVESNTIDDNFLGFNISTSPELNELSGSHCFEMNGSQPLNDSHAEDYLTQSNALHRSIKIKSKSDTMPILPSQVTDGRQITEPRNHNTLPILPSERTLSSGDTPTVPPRGIYLRRRPMNFDPDVMQSRSSSSDDDNEFSPSREGNYSDLDAFASYLVDQSLRRSLISHKNSKRHRSKNDIRMKTPEEKKKAMIWSEEEARSIQTRQIGRSACGPTAILNILRAFNIHVNQEEVTDVVSARLRSEHALLPEYIFSRAIAGTITEDLIEGIHTLTNGEICGRFFKFYPPKKVDLQMWLGDWIRKGAVPLATLNLQKAVHQDFLIPDAWHHQMVYGVGPKGIYLTNPIELAHWSVVRQQLCSDSVLLVRREDIVSRWTADCNLGKLMHNANRDKRWSYMNVLGQVVNVLREEKLLEKNESRYLPSITSHVQIPAVYNSGITLFIKRDSRHYKELMACEELPLLRDTRVPKLLKIKK